jgi:hypothetical protein
MKTKGIFLVINEKNETFSLTKIRPKKSTFGRRKKKKKKERCMLCSCREKNSTMVHYMNPAKIQNVKDMTFTACF